MSKVLDNAPRYITNGDGHVGVNFNRMPLGSKVSITLVGGVHATISRTEKGLKLTPDKKRTLKMTDIQPIKLGSDLIVRGESFGTITQIAYKN